MSTSFEECGQIVQLRDFFQNCIKEITKVAQKSGIDETRVKDIFIALSKGKKNRNVSERKLIDLYNKLDYFYKNCY